MWWVLNLDDSSCSSSDHSSQKSSSSTSSSDNEAAGDVGGKGGQNDVYDDEEEDSVALEYAAWVNKGTGRNTPINTVHYNDFNYSLCTQLFKTIIFPILLHVFCCLV